MYQSIYYVNSFINQKYKVSILKMKKNDKYLIDQIELPLCINCKYFLEHKTNYPFDDIQDDSLYGKCSIFGEIDLVTGEKKYLYASTCRSCENLCGKNGTKMETKD
jgi:hypothetical protein